MNPPKFDHLVVVMMENRSFDHMLGMLYSKDDPPPNGQTFDGVDGKNLFNNTTATPPAPVRVVPASSFLGVTGDPDHDYVPVQWQLFWKQGQVTSNLPGIPDPPNGLMSGFVADYQSVCPGAPACEIMSHFPTYDGGYQPGLSVLPSLARGFAVCDSWFASVPTQTLPNRSFCNAGTSNGNVHNSADWTKNHNPTIFCALPKQKLLGEIFPWRIYHDHLDAEKRGFAPEKSFALTIYIHWPQLHEYDQNPDYYRSVDRFEADAAVGDLPAYSFIEPRIMGYFEEAAGSPVRAPNDQHPAQDIRHGENLINRIYYAILKSPLRNRTLLVITYDEHGGIYDHVPPPIGVPAPQPVPIGAPFDFTRLGVRVPAVIVSPYIPAGTVYHPSPWCDHTAIIKTLTARWGLNSLTTRDAAAPDLSELLTLEEPRTDLPMPESWPNPALDERPPEQIPANDLQRDFVQLVARAHGLPPPGPVSTVADVINFFASVPKKTSALPLCPE